MSEKSRNLKIGIIGVGMVGDPIRRWFEEKRGHKRGIDLFCYDTDPKRGYYDDYNKADVIFVCVPTPPNPDGSCNTEIVEAVAGKIEPGKIVVIKSTVSPGTTEKLQKLHPNNRFLFNPEFLTEAQAWEDFLHPVRQIIGWTEVSRNDALTILNLLPQGNFQSPWIVSTYVFRNTTATEAEIIKYASNVFGSMKVAYANVVFDVCHVLKANGLEIDYDHVRDALGADPRIGPAWIDVDHGSYRGFGGYCFPKDLRAFIIFSHSICGDKPSVLKKLLTLGIDILESVWYYNNALLDEQNLSIEDVSKHNKELILKKKNDIE